MSTDHTIADELRSQLILWNTAPKPLFARAADALDAKEAEINRLKFQIEELTMKLTAYTGVLS